MPDEMISFTVTIPKTTLEDLALNIHGVESLEGISGSDLASLLQDVISAGIEDYLGESDDVAVQIVEGK